jgi:hypothetical protein
MYIPGQLIYPGFKAVIFPERMPVFDDPVKQVLRQILACRSVEGETEHKIVQPQVISLKQN